MDAAEVLKRAHERAKHTRVFEHPETGVVTVIAHPGQTANEDPTYLRQNHGIVAAHLHGVKWLSETSQAPRLAAEKLADFEDPRDKEIRELRAQVEALTAPKSGRSSGSSGS